MGWEIRTKDRIHTVPSTDLHLLAVETGCSGPVFVSRTASGSKITVLPEGHSYMI